MKPNSRISMVRAPRLRGEEGADVSYPTGSYDMLPRDLPGILTGVVATSFSLLSLVLEWAVEQTHSAPPELTNVTL